MNLNMVTKMKKPKIHIGYTLCLILLIVGLLRFHLIIWSYYWPETRGIIVDAYQYDYIRSIGEMQKSIFLWFYEYEVAGEKYISDRIHPGLNKNSGDHFQGIYKDESPIGKEVKVYYNPKKPSEAILIKGFHWSDWVIPAFSGFFMLIIYLNQPRKEIEVMDDPNPN